MSNQSVVRRTSLFVRDMERSLAFYTGVFGLTIYHEREVDMNLVPDFPLVTRPPGKMMRLAILRGGDPLIGMIGLMEVTGLPEPDHDPRKLGYGSAALVLATPDAAAAADQVEAHGGTILMPLKTARNIGDESGEVVPARLFMAFDPDGYFLEVFEPL
jgi:predicted enzyme related to lactoylglutathione lyase